MVRFLKEFREFIDRGNVMDLAVAVIVGGAFTAITSSLVGDLVTPLLSLVTGGMDFSSLGIVIGTGEHAASIRYGMFIQSVINFLIISFVIFLMVKTINKVARRKPEVEAPVKTCPYCTSSIPEQAVRCPACTTVLDASKVPEDLR
ncbi:MAG: large conductance mechanosensitive channel protein MscL [Coriobacteriales bacterium]|jgi:large conductance mechanosensitive channel|nr:large conductance mechanosensitive channel protein MscL [Coriobacteriales bacterium]